MVLAEAAPGFAMISRRLTSRGSYPILRARTLTSIDCFIEDLVEFVNRLCQIFYRAIYYILRRKLS